MRPLRISNPEAFRLLTIRTVDGRFFMRPSPYVRDVIGGVIARYQEILNIEIYAFAFLSNHFHMIVRAPDGNTDEFMENVNREIARRLNALLGRRGQFWSRRYSDQEIQSEEDLLEAFVYVTTNAVRHGLTKKASQWRGLNSIEQSITGREKRYHFHHLSKSKTELVATEHKLKVSVLPHFQELTDTARAKEIRRLVREREKEIAERRDLDGEGFLGMALVMTQSPFDRPEDMSVSPRPPCYSKLPALIKEFISRMREIRTRYNEASVKYRLGQYDVEFPDFTFRPPVHRAPRLVPFTPLKEAA